MQSATVPQWGEMADHPVSFQRGKRFTAISELGPAGGVWESINAALALCVRVRRESEPSLTVIDSQSVKLGRMGPKLVDGSGVVVRRKRHIAVDALGLVR
jgi:hypothetical protein